MNLFGVSLYKRIIINCSLGLAILYIIQHYDNHPFVRSKQEVGLDSIMKLSSGLGVSEESTPFAFLNIDSASFRAWDEPLYTPLAKLTRLMDYAIGAEAGIVIVDIDLNRRSAQDTTTLYDYLSALADHLAASTNTHVVLMKTFKERLTTDSPHYQQARVSPLDDIVSVSPYMHWASPLFSLDDDQHIRRWRAVERICHDGKPVLYPAIQLATYAISQGNMDVLNQQLKALTPATCDQWEMARFDKVALTLGDRRFSLQHNQTLNRIIFDIPWADNDPNTYPVIAFRTDQGEVKMPIVVSLAAQHITDSDKGLSGSIIQGRNVIIGASHFDSKDLYLTPLGLMPGSVIIINAIHSLINYESVEKTSLICLIIANIAMITLLTLIYARFSPLEASLICIFLYVVFILPMTMFFFKSGILLNFAVPLIVVQIFEIINLAQRLSRRNQSGANHA